MKKRILALTLAVILAVSIIPIVSASASSGTNYITDPQTAAENLNKLDLIHGSDLGYELERAPNRIEGIVLYIRLLGKDDEAINGNWTHPFTDVPLWADQYIGYAFENGIINGISEMARKGIAPIKNCLTWV